MTRTILVGAHLEHADGDPIALAVELARVLEAQLVLGAVHVPSGAGDEAAEHERFQAELDELRAIVPSDVAARTETVDATSVVHGLHDLADRSQAELLVLGAHHRSGLVRALRGDTAAQVAFTASCGVVVAHPSRTTGRPMRIGVGWDQTPPADAALEWATQYVERTEGELQILRALDPSHREGTHPGTHDQVRLAAAEESTRLRVRADARVLWGDPAPELLKASHELDLLVLGARPRTALRLALLGSTTARVIHDAHCPVVVIPAA